MGRLVYEGNAKVYFLTTVASTTAPTVANINAGTNLSPFITRDGVAVPNSQNMVESASIDDIYNAEVVGTWGGGALTLTMYRDDATDTAWNLIVYGTNGYIVISRFGSAASAGKKVEVWPVEMHSPVPGDSGQDMMQTFTAAFAVTATPVLTATVAA